MDSDQRIPPSYPNPVACEKTICKETKVKVPIKIKPSAEAGRITIECCNVEECSIDCCQSECYGEENISLVSSEDSPNTTCTLTVDLGLRLKIPVSIGATAEVGKPFINCGTTPILIPNDPPDGESCTTDCRSSLVNFLKQSKGNIISLGTEEGVIINGELKKLEDKIITLENGLLVPHSGKPTNFTNLTISLDSISFWISG